MSAGACPRRQRDRGPETSVADDAVLADAPVGWNPGVSHRDGKRDRGGADFAAGLDVDEAARIRDLFVSGRRIRDDLALACQLLGHDRVRHGCASITASRETPARSNFAGAGA